MSRESLTVRRIEQVDSYRLRVDGGLWAQGVHIGDHLVVEERDGTCTHALVELGADERPDLVTRSPVYFLRGVQLRRVVRV